MLPIPTWFSFSSQELNNCLAAEITRLRTLLTGEGGGEAAGSPLTQGKDAYELEVSELCCAQGAAQVPLDPQEHATAIHRSRQWVSVLCIVGCSGDMSLWSPDVPLLTHTLLSLFVPWDLVHTKQWGQKTRGVQGAWACSQETQGSFC